MLVVVDRAITWVGNTYEVYMPVPYHSAMPVHHGRPLVWLHMGLDMGKTQHVTARRHPGVDHKSVPFLFYS